MSPAELFGAHASRCARCAKVELERPASLALACLEGSKLFKDAAQVASAELRRQIRRRPPRVARPPIAADRDGTLSRQEREHAELRIHGETLAPARILGAASGCTIDEPLAPAPAAARAGASESPRGDTLATAPAGETASPFGIRGPLATAGGGRHG